MKYPLTPVIVFLVVVKYRSLEVLASQISYSNYAI